MMEKVMVLKDRGTSPSLEQAKDGAHTRVLKFTSWVMVVMK